MVFLRIGNNHPAAFRDQCNGLATAVQKAYTHGYEETVEYLRGLARNTFWESDQLPDLPWHRANGQEPGPVEPEYRLHPTVLAAIAPSVALRATFGGRRDV